MSASAVVHSDILVHWTGRDIEKKHSPNWQIHRAPESSEVVDAYLDRLKSILTHGLWMTNQEIEFFVKPERQIEFRVPCVCFTELKLSQSKSHATDYGRLGIGLKRPFVFSRDGRPVVYFEPRFGKDVLFDALVESNADSRFLHFWKRMGSKTQGMLEYDWYSESEWRIVQGTGERVDKAILDPRNTDDQATVEYFNSMDDESKAKLQYLVPLDGWIATIIYPSYKIKNIAQDPESGIPQLIREVASRGGGFKVEGLNLPAEMDLDLCMHF